jgi:hypothetical protein
MVLSEEAVQDEIYGGVVSALGGLVSVYGVFPEPPPPPHAVIVRSINPEKSMKDNVFIDALRYKKAHSGFNIGINNGKE